ncbi:MAG: hypothetical protein AB1593_06370 [Pseudomonadota bacterium]
MPADQAAGLRWRRQGLRHRCVQCISDTPGLALRAAQSLRLEGASPLVVDARDRLFVPAAPQALFDWTRQLARGALLILPLGGIPVWHAPGARADAAGLAQGVRAWDTLIFDSPLCDAAAVLPGATQCVLMEVRPEGMQSSYALLKTRAERGGGAAILFGDAQACAQVHAACARFLGATFAAAVMYVANEDDAIAALAVRMADEEPGLSPQYRTTGNT